MDAMLLAFSPEDGTGFVAVILFAVASIIAVLVGKFAKFGYRAICYAMFAFGFAPMLPLLLTDDWQIIDVAFIPQSTSVPAFKAGILFSLVGAAMLSWAKRLG